MVTKKDMEVDGWNTIHYDGSKVANQMNRGRESAKLDHGAVAQGVASMLTKVMEEKEEQVDNELRALDNAMESEDAIEKIRRQRIQQMKAMQAKNEAYTKAGHGTLKTIEDQKEFFAVAQASDKVICHFFTTTNRQCDLVDDRLTELAKRHKDVKCIRIDAERSPYVSEKLKIYMIPSMVLIQNGQTEHTITGFDELGGHDKWTVSDLEKLLSNHGILSGGATRKQTGPLISDGSVMYRKRWNEEDSEEEWD